MSGEGDIVSSEYKNSDVAKKNYDAAMDGNEDTVKGVHMCESPYLWKENNVAIERDNPTENFVPTPVINVGDDTGSKAKKFIKIALIILLVGFMIYALIANLIENPDFFRNWRLSKNRYF